MIALPYILMTTFYIFLGILISVGIFTCFGISVYNLHGGVVTHWPKKHIIGVSVAGTLLILCVLTLVLGIYSYLDLMKSWCNAIDARLSSSSSAAAMLVY